VVPQLPINTPHHANAGDEKKKHVALTPCVQRHQTIPFSSHWILLSQISKFQHLAPTIRVTRKHPAIAPKRASSKAAASIDDAAKAALLAKKKGKALADNTLQEAFEDDTVNSKRQRQDNPTPDGTVRTCSSEGAPRASPPGFAPLEGEDTIEDGEIIGISTEDQLKLRALRIKNNHLQKQKEILEAKRQRVTMQAKVRQMILDEEQKAREVEQEIALIQGEGLYNLQCGPLAAPITFQQNIQGRDPYHLHRAPLVPQQPLSRDSITSTSEVRSLRSSKRHPSPPTLGPALTLSTMVAPTRPSTS
jgi:hypothetical protein